MKGRRADAVTILLGVAMMATTIAVAGPTSAAPRQAAAGPIMPVTPCSSLAGMDFSAVPDAPGRVTASAVVSDPLGPQNVSFCDIKGVFAPQTHFEIKLPTATWHGQYVQEGCTALCGSVQAAFSDFPLTGFTCAAADNGELALAADDEGHTGDVNDGSWARNSLLLRVVFGLTSEHSLAQMSKAIITAYYGQPASHSYYDGCSTGGREALILAQRYPDDFDGIVAGAPAGNLAPLNLLQAWMVRSNTDPQGHQIVNAEKIPALHAAVVTACGDGDGIIADPRQCGFDPASIQCHPARTPMRV